MPKVREVEYSDFPAVVELLRAGQMGVPVVEKWHHLWDDNPAVPPNGQKLARGWVLEENGRIVGFVYNIGQRFQIGDRSLLSAFPGSLIVDPEFRGQSMQLVLPFMRQKGVDLFLNTTCSIETAQIFKFLKYATLPQPEYDENLYWILRESAFLNAAFRKKQAPAILAKLAATMLGPGLRLEAVVRGRTLKAPSKTLTTRPIEVKDAGPEFDVFWTRKIHETRKLLAVRDAATLRWHFAARDRKYPPFLVGAFEGDNLVGYAAILFHHQPNFQLLRSYLADLCVLNDDPAIIRMVFAAAAREARRRGGALLEVVGLPKTYRDVLRQFHPRVRKMKHWPYYYKAADPALHAELAAPALWHAGLFDGDGSL